MNLARTAAGGKGWFPAQRTARPREGCCGCAGGWCRCTVGSRSAKVQGCVVPSARCHRSRGRIVERNPPGMGSAWQNESKNCCCQCVSVPSERPSCLPVSGRCSKVTKRVSFTCGTCTFKSDVSPFRAFPSLQFCRCPGRIAHERLKPGVQGAHVSCAGSGQCQSGA